MFDLNITFLLLICNFIFNSNPLFYGLTLLITQINFIGFFQIENLNFIELFELIKNVIDEHFLKYFGIEKSLNLNSLDIIYFNDQMDTSLIKKIDEPKSDFIGDQYDIRGLVEQFMEYFYVYKWFLLPICLYLMVIYILHSIFGLYSAYVDYYQKNPDHFSSARGFIPALFILFLFLFSFFSIFFFVKIQYLKYFLWVLFI